MRLRSGQGRAESGRSAARLGDGWANRSASRATVVDADSLGGWASLVVARNGGGNCNKARAITWWSVGGRAEGGPVGESPGVARLWGDDWRRRGADKGAIIQLGVSRRGIHCCVMSSYLAAMTQTAMALEKNILNDWDESEVLSLIHI